MAADQREAEMKLVSTDVADIPEMVAHLRQGFKSHKTLSWEYRVQQLKNLKRLLVENKDRMKQALYHDLHKNETEAMITEINVCISDVTYALDNLRDWMAPNHKPRGLIHIGNQVYTQAEPYGVVLIIAPWNYPIQLTILVLIGAIAAGNACLVKPSECSVACSNLLGELIPRYLDNECYALATGGIPVSQAVLKERYDYIFYTGSTNVGRIVMEHAAKHLTPVTLELGGKSPVIIADDADIDVAAKRIVWGKFLNAGQTCIAPDYILCPPDKQKKLVECCKKALKKYYGEDPKTSNDYGRIIHDRHFQRLLAMLRDTGGTIAHGGDSDEAERYISPTLITNIAPDDKLMEEEIFGPLLPFIAVKNVDEAIQFVNDREKPLAFYVFTNSKARFEYINRRTSAGGVTHNDTLMHNAVIGLPFGGVGHSGMGAYHYKYTFDTFSHYKPVLSTSTALEGLNQMLRAPPFSKAKLNRLKWVLGPPRKRSPWLSRLVVLCLLVLLGALLVQLFGVPSWVYAIRGK